MLSELQAAQELVKHDRPQGLAALNTLFRSGTVPEPALHGRYAGELVTLDLTPGLTPLFQALTSAWMPWRGKTFHAAHQSGDNIFTRDLYLLARFFNPFYWGFVAEGLIRTGASPSARIPRPVWSTLTGRYLRSTTT